MTVHVDDFDRGSLGTTGPNGAPWEGDPSGWLITGNQLTTTGAADNQLVVDAGVADVSVALTLAADNGTHDVGILARWVDATHYVAVSVRGDVNQIILYVRNGGFSVVGWFNAGASPAGKTLAVDVAGNDFTVTWDGVVLGTLATSFQAGETRVGIWSYHSTIAFDDFTIDDGLVATPELDTGHLTIDGGDLGVPGTTGQELATGHINIVAPTGSFSPGSPPWPGDFFDDFERSDVNPAGNGYTYQGEPESWAVTGGTISPVTRAVKLLVYVVDSGNVTITVARLDANIGLTEICQPGGFILGYQNPDNYVTVVLYAAFGTAIINVTERVSGVPTDHGNWLLPSHVGVLSAQLAEGRLLTVSFNDGELGAVTLTRETSGALGLYGDYNDSDLPPPAVFDALTIEINPPVVPQPMRLELNGGHMGSVADNALVLAPVLRSPVAYGPRITQPGTYTPPIVAKAFRLRDWTNPVVTLDQSTGRTWQEQLGEAGSGSVTLLNDDPDLALIRDGDVVRFELYGEAAFSCVVTGRDKTTIAEGEEHDQTTTLTGPGLLSWITSSMLIYPARQPPPMIHGPAFDRYIQGEPIEEDRVFSWASYDQLVDNDVYGPTVALGSMPDPLPEGWPEGVTATRIWVPEGDVAGPVYFRMGFTTDAPSCEIYIHTPLMDPVKAWLDGSLMYESEGGPDNGDVGTVGGTLSDLGVDEHVLCIKVEHVTGPAWLAVLGLGIDDEGEFIGQIMGTADTWLAVAYPLAPPAVTAGAVLQAVIGEMNSRRYNPQLGVGFTTETDSDGNPWPPLPEVTTKVGTTVWAFLQEMADYVEVWMGHNPNVLYAWVAGGRGNERNVTLHGPTDPHDPNSSNLRGLTHKRAT